MLATSSSINPRPPPTPHYPSSTTQNPSNHSTHQPLQHPRRPATPFAHNFLSPMPAQEAAFARGLSQMPPVRLTNQYFLVRAWEFEYESIGVINKNLVAKTSVDNGLSEKGKKQAVRSAFDLNEMGAGGKNCWIWPSITQRAYPAAEIIAAVNGVSRRCTIISSQSIAFSTPVDWELMKERTWKLFQKYSFSKRERLRRVRSGDTTHIRTQNLVL